MAKLDRKSQPVVIPPVPADYLKVLVGQRVVAGNISLAHREMRFEKFRPLCGGQQFVRRNGTAPDSGGGEQSRLLAVRVTHQFDALGRLCASLALQDKTAKQTGVSTR